MMYALSLLIFIISIVIFCSNPKSGLRRWFSAFLFFMACGVLSIAFFIAFHKPFASKLEIWGYIHLNSFLYVESNCFMPYTLLVFSLLLGPYKGIKRKYLFCIKLVLLVPIAVMHFIEPPGNTFNMNVFVPSYTPWSVFYFLCSPILSIHAYLMEKNSQMKLKKLIISLFIISVVATVIILGYILPSTYDSFFYGFLNSVIPVILVLFLLLALKFGMLGFKLKVEREHFNTMMGSMTAGAAIISHSIKNEVAKIAVCTNNIKSQFSHNEAPYIAENLTIIEHTLEHLSEMTQRIKFQMQDFEMSESKYRLTDIIEQALSLVQPVMSRKGIVVSKQYLAEVDLICDQLHIKEVLINLFMNAIEAMETEGVLEVTLSIKHKDVQLSIKDNGRGISDSDMPNIYNPFFTTKKQRTNYGLGLSYCYGVMKKHGASILIKSIPHTGTVVTLTFPRKKVIHYSRGGEVIHG